MDINREILTAKSKLERFAKSITAKTRIDWQDLIQNTVIRILEHQSSYDPTRDFLSWAYTVCKNCFYIMIRRPKYDVSFEDHMSPMVIPRQDTLVYLKEVNKKLANIKPELANIKYISSHFRNQNTIAETAAEFNVSEKTIQNYVYRARKELRLVAA